MGYATYRWELHVNAFPPPGVERAPVTVARLNSAEAAGS